MRGYVEAREALHKYGSSALNDTERALVAPSSAQLAANEDAVAEAELDLIVLPERIVHYLTDMGAQYPACGAKDDNGCAYVLWRVTCPACLEEMDDE